MVSQRWPDGIIHRWWRSRNERRRLARSMPSWAYPVSDRAVQGLRDAGVAPEIVDAVEGHNTEVRRRYTAAMINDLDP